MTQASAISIRSASLRDLPAIEHLLIANRLPLVGVRDAIDDFLVAEQQGELVGAIGLEKYDDCGLLRSAAVTDEARGTGVGAALVERLIALARGRGMRELVLLTTTAEGWFPRFGFVARAREQTPAPIQRSAEFRGACPASATVMTLDLAS